MQLIPLLIALPLAFSVAIFITKNVRVRSLLVYFGAGLLMIATLAFLFMWLSAGAPKTLLFDETSTVDFLMSAVEIFIVALVVVFCVLYKKYWIILLSVAQTALMIWLENTYMHFVVEEPHIQIDCLSMLMCMIVAFVGGFISIYAVGYMKAYHEHHTEFKDRSSFFLSMLFLFLAAMMGLVLSASFVWMYFFWEITSIISFLLIGYTRTREAIDNSFKALWMNLLGGVGFACAIAFCAIFLHTVQISDVVSYATVAAQAAAKTGAGAAATHAAVFSLNTLSLQIPIVLLAFAALTKSAQLPFSGWLLGAMVAPTPSSALLHSATMVKAGIYLLIRISPAMAGTTTGTLVSLIGGFTFIATSMMAISQSDGKKVLAFSTISNLGLIVACAGIGAEETIWAAVLLMIFHAVSKSMLFQAVGATENSLGSRDIEDMHGLVLILPKLTYIMGIGIAGMYLAPFGMLISKWVALKSFVDAGNVILVIFLAFGSATTMLYWTKWLSKLMVQHKTKRHVQDKTTRDQYISMYIHAACMLLLCMLFPLLGIIIVNPIINDLFGYVVPVLSVNELIFMTIMLFSVIVVPSSMFLVTKRAKRNYVPIYMSGVNEGDNHHFTNSFGQSEQLYLTNWYMQPWFGIDKLMRPSQVLAFGTIVVFMCMIFGGAL